jgi:hypothetical protein
MLLDRFRLLGGLGAPVEFLARPVEAERYQLLRRLADGLVQPRARLERMTRSNSTTRHRREIAVSLFRPGLENFNSFDRER